MFDQDNVPDKFEYSRYLFAGYCMNTIGRRYMFITPESLRVNSSKDVQLTP